MGRWSRVAIVLTAVGVLPASAQQSGITRVPVQTADFPAGYQTVSAIVQIGPMSCAGRHNHPGVEIGYMMEGELLMKIEGKPDQVYKVGDSYQLPEGLAHDPCNATGNPNKLLVVYVVEKGKPLASPVK
jgi:hypothetical protein